MLLVWGPRFENQGHRAWERDPGGSFPVGEIFWVSFVVIFCLIGIFCLVLFSLT